MLSAATWGLVLRCSTRDDIGPAPPVDQLMSTGQRFCVSSWMLWAGVANQNNIDLGLDDDGVHGFESSNCAVSFFQKS